LVYDELLALGNAMRENNSNETFVRMLLNLDRLGAEKMLAQAQVEQETEPLILIEKFIVPALDTIGKGWEQGSIALAQVYMSSRICEELVEQFLPRTSTHRIQQPNMGIALLDDYHALGKVIISAALRSSGYALHDYGRLTALELVEQVQKDALDIILISTLMLRSALQVRTVRDMLRASACPTRIIVGGAPFRFDPELWKEVGADGMGSNALEALELVSRCCTKEGESI
jgi:methanogenic corrinoid protein MtbC1